MGLEPMTSSVTGWRSNQLNYRAVRLEYFILYSLSEFRKCEAVKQSGRGRRARTLGTRFWRPLLYQLSYSPVLYIAGNVVLMQSGETHLVATIA